MPSLILVLSSQMYCVHKNMNLHWQSFVIIPEFFAFLGGILVNEIYGM